MPTTKKISIDADYDAQKLNVRAPEVCVDYLSYHFDEMDLAASWQVVTKRKNDIVNGIRLENASWRTWAKHKYHLKTISPETLNWLKDSDVTWLYGPLHTVIDDMAEKDRFAKPKVSTTEDMLGLMRDATREQPLHMASTSEKPPLKSALKKVTASDLLKRSATAILSVTDEPISIRESNKQMSAFSPSVIATHRQPKLRFNPSVEQCIALPANEERDLSEKQGSVQQGDSTTVPGHTTRKSSIRKIAPTRLKNSTRSDLELDDLSSLSSSATSIAAISSSSSSSSVDDSRQHFLWLDHQGHAHDRNLASITTSSLPSKPVSVNHVPTVVDHQDPTQWAGQSYVYETNLASDLQDRHDSDDEDWDQSQPPLPPSLPVAPAPASPSLSSTHCSHDYLVCKSVAVNVPSALDVPDPSLNFNKAVALQHTATTLQRVVSHDDLDTDSDRGSSSTAANNQTMFGHITQWASSYLWPKSFG